MNISSSSSSGNAARDEVSVMSDGVKIKLLALLVVVTLMLGAGHAKPMARRSNSTSEGGEDYSRHSVYRMYPDTREQVVFLQGLAGQMPGCDVWKVPVQAGQPMDIMVDTAAHGKWLEQQLTAAHFKWNILVGNVQALMDAETADSGQLLSEHGGAGTGINIQAFNTHDDIAQWLHTLATAYPNLCEIVSLGESFEGRQITVIRIGSGGADTPAIWIDGGIHSREWITTATAVWFIHKLLTEYEQSADVRRMVDSFHWYINPVFNPDGYHYSRTTQRLWRKTRSTPHGAHDDGFPFGPQCVGADPDRNWDVAWGESGSSADECSEVYSGREAMSERCVRGAAAAMAAVSGGAGPLVYMALHSYGQLWMYPYAHSAMVCPDCLELANVGRAAVAALASLHGTRYLVGSTEEMLYSFSGSSVDYAYSVLGVKYSYYIELRDSGRYGFIIPTSMIPDTADETWLGVESVAKAMLPPDH